MSVNYLFTWALIFMRSLGIVILMPQMAGKTPPATVRICLGMALATLLVGVVPMAQMPSNDLRFIYEIVGEILLGLTFGFMVQMTFSAVDLAARLSSSEVGLSGSPGLNAPEMGAEPLASFISSFAVVLFFMFGGHLMVISAFARSFTMAPAGAPFINAAAPELMIQQTSHVIELGLRIAAPFIALNFLVNLAFAALGRAVPRLSVFVLSMPVRGLVGFSLLGGVGGLIARYYFNEIAEIPTRLLQLLETR